MFSWRGVRGATEGRRVRLYLVPDKLELSDELAGFGGGGGVFVHCGDKGGDVTAFGFGAREGVVGGPGVPIGGQLVSG